MRVLVLLILSGCYVETRGAVVGAVNRSGDGGTAHDLDASVGFGGSNHLSSGAGMIGIEGSPLVRRDPTGGPARVPLLSIGGRYEHAFTPEHPTVRGFVRLALAFNPCASDSTTTMPGSSCSTVSKRSADVASVGLGVALTTTRTSEEHDELVPSVASVGLGLAYSHASDDVYGSADFLGLELSFGMGGDPLAPLFRHEGH